MKVPNAEQAVIAPEKLRDYLLNVKHEHGGTKAKALVAMGYAAADWPVLAAHLREQHLPQDVVTQEDNDYGASYVIVADLTGPAGATRRWRSVWQIDDGSNAPRLITMYPEKQS